MNSKSHDSPNPTPLPCPKAEHTIIPILPTSLSPLPRSLPTIKSFPLLHSPSSLLTILPHSILNCSPKNLPIESPKSRTGITRDSSSKKQSCEAEPDHSVPSPRAGQMRVIHTVLLSNFESEPQTHARPHLRSARVLFPREDSRYF